ncbi:MAG: hypothetical protein AB7T74_04755 [Clostridia bacterium]|jgi:hypothetical protein
MMFKTNVVVVALVFVLVSGFLSPLTAQESSTLIPAGQSTIDGRSWLAYTGPGDIRVLALTPFPADAGKRLERTVAVISAWPTIRVTEVRAESGKGVDDYVLFFSSIQSGGKEYSANVPGGLRLRYDGALMYDFRVRSGDYFVRVRGILMDEASLIAEIVKAVNDPGGYIAERDPAWLALQVERLDKVDTTLDRRADRLDSRTDENAAVTMEIKADFEARFTEYNARIEKLQADAAEDRRVFEETLSSNQALLESLAGSLRLALASEMNKGLFGGPKPLDPAMIDHVVALKTADPGTDRATALESAKAAGLTAKAKQIDIIFRIWFGE